MLDVGCRVEGVGCRVKDPFAVRGGQGKGLKSTFQGSSCSVQVVDVFDRKREQ